MDESTEQRIAPRVPIGYRIKVVTDDELVSYTSALNISIGGLLLAPPMALEVGGQCGVVIFLLDGELGKRVVARGTVVRSNASGTAIQFQNGLGTESYEALVALVDSLSPESNPVDWDTPPVQAS